MISEDNLQALTAACRDGDQVALDQLAPRIGLALDLAGLRELLRNCRLLGPDDVAAVALQALDVEHGVASTIVKRPRSRSSSTPLNWECVLAVRTATHVVVGARNMTGAPASVPKAWQLAPWSAELARNREVCERWASEPGEPRLSLPIVARPKLVVTSARLTEAELMREIVAHPEDDAPRQVLADLLMQRGDVRGELIQLHAQLATNSLDDAAIAALRERMKSIIENHRAHLAGEIGELVKDYWFAGGFVDGVTMSAPAFRKHGARVFSLQPVRELVVQPSSEEPVRKVITSPHFPVVRALRLGSPTIEPNLSFAVLRGITLPRLEELTLAYCRPLDEAEVAFAELDAPRLHTLRCVGSAVLPPTALRGLATNSRLASSLGTLDLDAYAQRGNPTAEAIADAVFEHWKLPNLTSLALGRCWFDTDPQRIVKLVRSAPRLRAFVQRSKVERVVVNALLECRDLERLEIEDTLLGEAMLERVLELPRLHTLVFDGATAAHSRPLAERLLALPASHSLRRVKIVSYTFSEPLLERGGPLHQRFPWPPSRSGKWSR